MFNLRPLDSSLDLPKFFKSIRRSKAEMVLDFVPSAEEYEFLILAIFIDAPTASVAVRARIFAKMRSASFENTLELGLFARLNEVPTYAQDWCVEGDGVCRRLSRVMSVYEHFHL